MRHSFKRRQPWNGTMRAAFAIVALMLIVACTPSGPDDVVVGDAAALDDDLQDIENELSEIDSLEDELNLSDLEGIERDLDQI